MVRRSRRAAPRSRSRSRSGSAASSSPRSARTGSTAPASGSTRPSRATRTTTPTPEPGPHWSIPVFTKGLVSWARRYRAVERESLAVTEPWIVRGDSLAVPRADLLLLLYRSNAGVTTQRRCVIGRVAAGEGKTSNATHAQAASGGSSSGGRNGHARHTPPDAPVGPGCRHGRPDDHQGGQDAHRRGSARRAWRLPPRASDTRATGHYESPTTACTSGPRARPVRTRSRSTST